MAGLSMRLKEVSGLMPVLRQVVDKQIDIDIKMNRLMEVSDEFLTQVNLDVEWQRFQNKVTDLVKERLDEQEKKLTESLKAFALKSEVEERLSKKASSYDYGNLYRDVLDLRLSLNPLIERKHTLEKFIAQVVKAEINEVNAKELNQKLEQVNFRITELTEKIDFDFTGFTQRLTAVEGTS